MRRQKFGNSKTTVDNVKFDSKKEAARYEELKMLERAGEISGLVLQPQFRIVESVKWNGKTLRERFYIADFSYKVKGQDIITVEDVKGVRTAVYTLKRQLFLSQYPMYRFIES